LSDNLGEVFTCESYGLDCIVVVIVEIDSLIGHVYRYNKSKHL